MPSLFDSFSNRPHLGAALRERYSSWNLRLLENFKFHANENIYIREVLHQNKDRALVYAYVELPAETYLAFQADFDLLGERSLGESFLFARKDVVREAFSFFSIGRSHSLYETAQKYLSKSLAYPARSSYFTIAQFPLLITEVFDINQDLK